jgi:hypothetical protein
MDARLVESESNRVELSGFVSVGEKLTREHLLQFWFRVIANVFSTFFTCRLRRFRMKQKVLCLRSSFATTEQSDGAKGEISHGAKT